jgi:hypothetical protein
VENFACYKGDMLENFPLNHTVRLEKSMRVLIPLLIFLLPIPALAAKSFAAAQVPYFQITASEKRALAEKATIIKVGDSYKSVIQELGKPTFDQPLVAKTSDRVIGRNLKYYAVVWENGVVNELNDELVEVFLDESDQVVSVYIRLTLTQ